MSDVDGWERDEQLAMQEAIQTTRFKIAELTQQLAAATASLASKDALLEQARKALAAMVLEAKARYCGLRIADETLAAIEHYQTKGEES